MFVPYERPQLLSVLVGIVAELLFELSDHGYWVLERVFPRLKVSRVWRLSRHRDCYVKERMLGFQCYVARHGDATFPHWSCA
jgi:hypothetical protein